MNGRRSEPPPRDPKHFVHGVDGPIAVIPGRVAAWLNLQVDLDRLRKEVRGQDSEIDNVLIALSVAATGWRASVFGTGPRNVPEPAPKSSWLTTTEVADLLNQTDRAIRMACQSGRLPAERVGDRWQINREDFEHYRAARRAA